VTRILHQDFVRTDGMHAIVDSVSAAPRIALDSV
jgi:hypothetical protein